jgi:hypothetical protein
MESVSILSMQRVVNYGSFLQAYAMKRVLEMMGYGCEFVDIIPGEVLNKMKKGIGYNVNIVINKYLTINIVNEIKYRYFMKKNYNNNCLKLLGVGNDYIYDVRSDVLIIGSDEVFNCIQKSKWGFSTQLFGDVKGVKNVITFAASFGHTTFDQLCNYKIEKIIKRCLDNVSAISVRDENTEIILRRLGLNNIKRHLDPVFLYDYNKEIKEISLSEKYILIYAYPRRILEKNEVMQIKYISKIEKLKIISIGAYYSWADNSIVVHPFELLSYFKKAEYVVTDTFHGVVLSIKYKKKFAVFLRNTNKYKISNLLNEFRMADHIITNYNVMNNVLKINPKNELIDLVIKDNYESALKYFNDNI